MPYCASVRINGLRVATKNFFHEIDTLLDRHKVDHGPVLRRERLDISSASIILFSECGLIALGREQVPRLGEGYPSPLARWQCRQGAGQRGLGCAVKLRGIGRIVAGPE